MRKRDHGARRPRGRALCDEQVHPTVRVEYGGLAADIDEDIAALILETWKAGVVTSCSCQDASALGREASWVRNWVQVGFPSFADAQKWVRIVARHAKGGRSLYNRMTQSGSRGVVCWHYEVSPYDAAYDEAEDRVFGQTALELRVFVYFPRRDLLTLMKRLRFHNTRGKMQEA